MKKIVNIVSAAVFIGCIAILIFLTLDNANSKNIIGGAGMPTILFSFRQVLLSIRGAVVASVGIIALIVLVVRKR
ncbi:MULTISPECIES: hypothetical protein [Ruminococcus]|uniref:hypothetical protein n=1 Tax=Ruminococcus TaxID=1263 RepID=UPI0002EA9B21|nr:MULTISPECIES: hypothetical protein [Ruminococcus]MCR5019667.1 hypothetical protein [Ruminococcus sp.]